MSELPSINELLRNSNSMLSDVPVTYEDELDRRRSADIAFRSALSTNPDDEARANRIARDRQLPQPIVKANLSAYESHERAQKNAAITKAYPAIGRWSADPRNVAVAQDDYDNLGKLGAAFKQRVDRDTQDFQQASGIIDRVGDLFKRSMYALNEGESTVRGALQAWSAANPLPWTSADNTRRERAGADASRAMARISRGVAGTAIAGEQTWEDLKAAPTVGKTLQFGLENTITSIPGMVEAGLALPLFVIGQAGTIGQARAENKGKEDAEIGEVAEALPAAFLVGVLERLGIQSIFGAPGKKAITRVAQAGAGEATTEFAQGIVQYIGETSQTGAPVDFGDMLDQAFAGAVAGGMGGAGIRGGAEITTAAAKPAKKLITSFRQADEALNDAAIIDQMGEAAAASKLKTRDKEAYSSLVKMIGEDTGVENVIISAESLNTYMQMDGYDGSLDAWLPDIEEGLATGGDVIIPIEQALSGLAGTPAWEALKGDMRLTPGGMSRNEAQNFEEAMADVMADLSDQMARQDESIRALATSQDKLRQTITDKLMNAGFTPTIASQQAELLTTRYTTRAERLGRELTGDEFAVEVRQVLPEKLAAVRKADKLDMTIGVMKRRLDPKAKRGRSLLEFIAARGGIEDRGGDLKAMGADKWHKGKPGRRKLVRERTDLQGSLASLGGRGGNENTADFLAGAAQDAGFFPPGTRPDVNALLDAIAEELAGRPTFAEPEAEAGMREAADELRAVLENRGIDPEKATNQQIREAVDGYVAEQAEGLGYDQSFEDGPRGRITFPAAGFGQGPSVINLFKSQNLSTFLHEVGHLWLEELRFDANDPDAPQQLKDDWAKVEAWFASQGHPVENGIIPVEAHELWARGVERYLMEGKAPTTALRKAFETFKGWLVSIYKTVSKLNAPITDEIRGVMDRLIATDQAIVEAAETQNIEALFDSAAQAGMSESEYAAYVETTKTARSAAHDALLAKVMASVKARVTAEYREQREAVRAEVEAEVNARPEFKALRILKATPIDSQWVRDTYGEDGPSLLPKQVPPVHKDNGANPDIVAELAGFRTGDEMVRALMGVAVRKGELLANEDKRSVRAAMIDQETDAIMNERYGDPFTDGSIEEEALALIHNDRQGEVMAAELRILGRSTGKRAAPYSIAKAWAANKVRSGQVRDMTSRSAIQRYERTASKSGKLAMEAIIAKDKDAAFRHKQAQMLNNALVSEAKKAADEIDKAVARLEKIATKKTIKSVDQDYLEQAQALLENVELRQRSQVSIDKQGKFEEWAAARTAEGHDIAVPPSFEASIGKTNWSRLTVENLLGLDDAVKQIIHLGRLKQTLIDNKEKREFEEVVSDALSGTGGMKRKPPSDMMEPGRWDSIKSRVASMDAALLKMETVFDWLDQGDSNGVFNRIVFRPIAEAQDAEKAMVADYINRLTGLLQDIPKPVLKRWPDRVTAPELLNRETGNPFIFTRDQLVSMALNMGNTGNAAKLAGGYGWNEGAVMAVLNRELSVEEWQYVQKVWDTIDSLWPQIEALERDLNGVAPDKVEARTLETSAGTLRGGYYPVVYDPRRSLEAEQQASKASDLFENIYTRATTPKGFTKERTKAERPVHLSLGVINRHVAEVIHDITHRRAIMQADKFLADKRIAKAVDETLGPEVRAQFRPWLQHIANEWAIDRAGNSGWEKFLKNMRTNTTIVGMGFRITTMLMQLAGYSNSFERVGAKWVSQAIAQTAKNPVRSFDFVMERSGEVRNRMDTLDRDIRDNVKRTLGKVDPLSQVRKFAFHGIGYMDRMVVIPTWLGAYNKATVEGMSEQEAIYAADKAVRQSQGSGAAKDLAAIQRGTGKSGELLKYLTMFYSYMSAVYQRQRTLGRDIAGVKSSADLPAILARSWWLLVVPPLLAEVPNILLGHGPEDDEDWSLWAFEKMLMQAIGPIPVVRDVSKPLFDKVTGQKGFGYSFTPAQRGAETLVNAAGDVVKLAEGEETKRATRNVLETVGYATGLIPGQVATATQFIVDVSSGDQDPETVSDWIEGLTKGKVSED